MRLPSRGPASTAAGLRLPSTRRVARRRAAGRATRGDIRLLPVSRRRRRRSGFCTFLSHHRLGRLPAALRRAPDRNVLGKVGRQRGRERDHCHRRVGAPTGKTTARRGRPATEETGREVLQSLKVYNAVPARAEKSYLRSCSTSTPGFAGAKRRPDEPDRFLKTHFIRKGSRPPGKRLKGPAAGARVGHKQSQKHRGVTAAFLGGYVRTRHSTAAPLSSPRHVH